MTELLSFIILFPLELPLIENKEINAYLNFVKKVSISIHGRLLKPTPALPLIYQETQTVK